jgi:hypothetical protein
LIYVVFFVVIFSINVQFILIKLSSPSNIAIVDDYRRILTVTSAGYGGEMSTSAAIRQYAAHFNAIGYKIVVAA